MEKHFRSSIRLKGLAALAAVGLLSLGCASPRSFDPDEPGRYYGDSSYNSYLSCLDTLTPYGHAAACETAGGGTSRQNYRNASVRGARIEVASVGEPGAGASDPYFEEMQSWPEEDRKAQEDAWLALAASYKGSDQISGPRP